MKKDKSKSKLVALIAILLSFSMVLAACSKEEETTKKKSKKSKSKQTEEIDETDPEEDPTDTSEDTEPTETSEDTEPTTSFVNTIDTTSDDSDRLAVAGTYNGYAVQTKADAYPEYGSVNNYPIINEDSALILNSDGTAVLEYAGGDDVEIEDWNVSGDQLTIDLAGTSVSGTIKDGIVTLDLTSTIMFFASDGADTSAIGAITPDEAYVVEGDDFYFGTGPSGFDLDSAKLCYETAGNAGVGKAWYCMGRIYQDKSLEEGRYATAMSYYEKAIELGDPYGWIGEGFLYAEGSGVEKDIAKAYTLFQQAADAGCLMGYNGMALLLWEYDEIPGIATRDGQKALEYYGKAAESKDWYEHVFAINGIGRLYRHGTLDVTQDAVIASEWFTRAANEGYTSSINNLANLYYRGEGVSQDYSAALQWYLKAAEMGYGSSCATLAYMYEYGLGVDQDPVKAVEYARKGAEYGDVTSMFDLGYYYKNGIGTAQDYELALECFLIAARENYARAFSHVGDMYCNGMGVEVDYGTALQYWLRGDELGDSSSSANVGWAYMYGKGVDVNYETALDYFVRAIYHTQYDGYQPAADYALERIDEMVDNGYITQEQADQALSQIG